MMQCKSEYKNEKRRVWSNKTQRKTVTKAQEKIGIITAICKRRVKKVILFKMKLIS